MTKKVYFIIPIVVLLLSGCLLSCSKSEKKFVTVSGVDLITPDGEKLLIRGTNLGNWLNPEGYMFKFGKCASARMINEMFCQAVGPDFTDEFWASYKDNYITYRDVSYIKSTGANLIRLPFHYKLFTDEDYMGLKRAQDGFARIDSLVEWCRRAELYLILDMHDAPGGQTGDNIDDSYAYPWLFESAKSQELYCSIWRQIAERYKDESVILGYELFNEPIAHFFENKDSLNAKLEQVYKMGVKAIRSVDTNHIIVLGGAQWNSNFEPLTDWSFDDKIIYSCHRYGGPASAEAIRSFIDFRDKTQLPMYMGEIGHNTNEWMSEFVRVMESNNIGWTFWPYKKLESSCFASIPTPENWDVVVDFAEASRETYGQIRAARPDMEVVRNAMSDFVEACRFENCTIERDYIKAIGLTPDADIRIEKVELWGDVSPKYTTQLNDPEHLADNGVIYNCQRAAMKIYLPQSPAKQTVLICPGGGYGLLAYRHEGEMVAEYLARNGIAAAVLAYRMPNRVDPIPLEDVERAMAMLREGSDEFAIDPANIGIMGFSAGGHLASTASVRLKPAFTVLYYPVISFLNGGGTCNNLIGSDNDKLKTYYSNHLHVTPTTPPTLIFHSSDDDVVGIEDSELYQQALCGNGVDVEFMVYEQGGHGWGFDPSFANHLKMKQTLLTWLNKR